MISFRPFYIPLGACFLFLGLTIYVSVVLETDRRVFYAKHHKVDAQVRSIHQTPFICVEIHSCECVEAPDWAPSCTTRQRDLTAGHCHQGERCCRKSCQYTGGGNHGTGFNTPSINSCTPKCVEEVARESCLSRRGNCTTVGLEVTYSFRHPSPALRSDRSEPSAYVYTFGQTCPIAKSVCLDEFLGSIRKGDSISIYIDETQPHLPERSSPDFSPEDSILAQVIVYPILTVCFALVAWKMFQ